MLLLKAADVAQVPAVSGTRKLVVKYRPSKKALGRLEPEGGLPPHMPTTPPDIDGHLPPRCAGARRSCSCATLAWHVSTLPLALLSSRHARLGDYQVWCYHLLP